VRDYELMARALELGRRVRRLTAPNPWVGCVIVRDGVIVGEGATCPPGGPHAEIVALDAAGARANGATVYTTLEPCSHVGRTGACSDALIAARVARVVSAIEDPDPHVCGHGHAALRAAGIALDIGICARESTDLLAAYVMHRRHGRSFTVVKTATSLDGRVASADGQSRWITGPAARADAHEQRADAQAIVVGSGTALADNPALTVRDATGPLGPPALRVVVDGRGRVPATGALFDISAAPTLVVTTDRSEAAARQAWADAGATVEIVASHTVGVDLGEMLAVLARRGVLQALVEGGPTLHGGFFAAELVDRVVAYVAPVILGAGGRAGYGIEPGPSLAFAPRLRLTHVAALGDDVRLDYDAPVRSGGQPPR
jgi:diaminohydroxyphosphoribosylaminopyrimidine deaminase/5-amino-6-(5-phosphoribosylamino)uracil reductase